MSILTERSLERCAIFYILARVCFLNTFLEILYPYYSHVLSLFIAETVVTDVMNLFAPSECQTFTSSASVLSFCKLHVAGAASNMGEHYQIL
jgi:hypothetical protein